MSHESNRTLLYAIASMVIGRNGQMKPDMTHVHAMSADHALWIFKQDPIHARKHKIIGIAPAVGFKVEDDHGDILSC